MVKATINNNFHNSSKNIRLNTGRNEIRGRRLREWKNALCCSDCTCSGMGGVRGTMDNPGIVDANGNALEYETAYENRTGAEYLVVWA